jgi:alpha-D-ribose 1-methylphosphonate 5-triphosphate diphosphatase PhnM
VNLEITLDELLEVQVAIRARLDALPADYSKRGVLSAAYALIADELSKSLEEAS